jgi:hypothetical protein
MMRSWCMCAFMSAHIIGGGLMLLAAAIFLFNFAKIQSLDPYRLIVLCLFFGTMVTLHGLSHAQMNRYRNKEMFVGEDEFTADETEVFTVNGNGNDKKNGY